MKYNLLKTAVLAAAVACAFSASAEGYQVNSLSARQNGMGHTGTSLKLGAESMVFNPAALAYMQDNIEFTGSVTGIFAHCTSTSQAGKFETNNGAATPMSFSLGMKVYDNFAAGIAFYTPYGSSIKWGENWPGSVLNEKAKLTVFTVQPTLSWRILPNLSIGAGAMISWGSVDLDKGLVTASSMNYVLDNTPGAPDYRFSSTTTPASVNLNGRAATTVGLRIGAMWDITNRITFGVDFRTKMDMTVKSGEATVSYANEMAQGLLQDKLGLINNANFKAMMPAVSVLNFGLSYRPTDRLLLAAEAQYSFWDAYDKLEINFLDTTLEPFNQHLPKHYSNSWTFHLGAQYAITHRMDLRAGLMIDTTPVNKSYYNPETPGTTKIEPSVGFSFRPLKNFSIDASLLYVAGLNVDDAKVSYKDFLLQKDVEFTSDYTIHAWAPAIGCTLRF